MMEGNTRLNRSMTKTHNVDGIDTENCWGIGFFAKMDKSGPGTRSKIGLYNEEGYVGP